MMDVTANEQTIGSKIDLLHAAREEKRRIESALKKQNERIETMERELLSSMESQGLEQARGRNATVSVQTMVKPHVTDWDAFYKFIGRKGYWHLLERRPSATGCRELFERPQGRIPGVVPFEKKQINMRST